MNKDVYAVNTGNVAAFVEESVSSKMTVVKETRVSALDDECTTLTAAERYVIEAGSYLAFIGSTDTSSLQLGEKIVSFITDDKDLDKYAADTVLTDFKPDVTGVYVFRRTISVDNTDQSETFEYVGYYYDADSGKYYKIELTSITPDDVADFAGNGKKTDGQLTDVNYVFFKDVTTTVTPTLKYDAANHKLVATVKGSSYIDDDMLKEYAEAYDTAIHEYQTALAEQTRAVDEDGDATDDLKDKLNALNAAKIAEANAKKAFKEALANYNAIASEYSTQEADFNNIDATVRSLINTLYTAGNDLVLYPPASLRGNDAYLTYDGSGNISNSFSDTDTLLKKLETAYANRDLSTDEGAFFADLKAWILAENIIPANYHEDLAHLDWDNTTKDQLVDYLSYEQLQYFKTWIAVNTTGENHNKWLKEAEYLIAKKAYQDKAAEYKAAIEEYNILKARISTETGSGGLGEAKIKAAQTLLGIVPGTPGGATARDELLADDLDGIIEALNKESAKFDTQTAYNTAIFHDGGLFGDWYDAAIDTEIAQADYDTAYAAVYTNGTSANVEAANLAVANAKAKLDLASKLYTDAVAEYTAGHDIVIYINLENDVTVGGTAEKWQILPSSIPTTGDDANVAYFYYTSILEGGETSKKLIDSVQLAPTVTQDMYKYFDFDLNVKLKSAQITYDSDNTTILGTAANDELDANVTLTTPTSIETALTWTTPTTP